MKIDKIKVFEVQVDELNEIIEKAKKQNNHLVENIRFKSSTNLLQVKNTSCIEINKSQK